MRRAPRRLRTGALVLACAGLAAVQARANTPHVDYMLECQGCHLADGTGSPGAVPSLRDSVGRFAAVPGGRAYLIRVPGSAQSGLSDAELAAVLNWMIRRFGPADAAAELVPFSAGEVAAHRPRPLLELEPLRGELLRRIEAARRPPEP